LCTPLLILVDLWDREKVKSIKLFPRTIVLPLVESVAKTEQFRKVVFSIYNKINLFLRPPSSPAIAAHKSERYKRAETLLYFMEGKLTSKIKRFFFTFQPKKQARKLCTSNDRRICKIKFIFSTKIHPLILRFYFHAFDLL
jgi:hypothetical protein